MNLYQHQLKCDFCISIHLSVSAGIPSNILARFQNLQMNVCTCILRVPIFRLKLEMQIVKDNAIF